MSAIHGLTHAPAVKVNPTLKQAPPPAAKPEVIAPPKAAPVTKPATTVDKTV